MTEKRPPSTLTLDPHMRRVALVIGYLLIAAGVAVGLRVAWPVIETLFSVMAPFVVALVAAYLFNPVVNFVQRRLHLTRIGGVIVLNLLILLVLGVFIAIVLPILVGQIVAAYGGLRDFLFERVVPWLQEVGVLSGDAQSFRAQFDEWLLANNLTIEELLRNVLGSQEVRNAATEGAGLLGQALGGIVMAVGRAIGSLIQSVMFLVFAALVSFYLLIDFASLRGVMEIMVPEKHSERFFDVAGKVDVAVGGFIRGQVTTAVLVGLMAFVGLSILGLKQYAVLIGCLAAVGNLIPYLGPVMGAAPAVLYMFFSGVHPTTKEQLIAAGLVLGLFGLIQFVEGFVFQPKIVGKAASLHPVAVIIALALGAQFGILGMILAVPAACILRVLVKEFYWDRREARWSERTGKRRLDDDGPAPPKSPKEAETPAT